MVNLGYNNTLKRLLGLLVRCDADLMLGLLNAFLGARNQNLIGIIGYRWNADFRRGDLFEIAQPLALLAQNPSVVLFRYRYLLAGLITRKRYAFFLDRRDWLMNADLCLEVSQDLPTCLEDFILLATDKERQRLVFAG